MAETLSQGTPTLFSPYKMGKFNLSHRSVFQFVCFFFFFASDSLISEGLRSLSWGNFGCQTCSTKDFRGSIEFGLYVMAGGCWCRWLDAGRWMESQGRRSLNITCRGRLQAAFSSPKGHWCPTLQLGSHMFLGSTMTNRWRDGRRLWMLFMQKEASFFANSGTLAVLHILCINLVGRHPYRQQASLSPTGGEFWC